MPGANRRRAGRLWKYLVDRHLQGFLESDLEAEAIGQLEEFLSSRGPRAPTALFGRAVA
jgi:hypothetical protein